MTNTSTAVVAGKAVSTSKKFHYLVFIGRFQPFHFGHLAILNKALELADQVIIVLGSAERPRTIKDPWTTQERVIMIRRNLSAEQKERVAFIEVKDQLYNDQKWVASVQQSVEALIFANTPSQNNIGDVQIGLIGHFKDDSSFYLKISLGKGI
jgi:bifunctional NMN adenylyltransferase/nudix hydrolase